MNSEFYTFIIGLEISIVIIGLFSMFSLYSFDRKKNKWLILAFAGMVWPYLNLLIGINRFNLISYSGFLQNPAPLLLFSPALYFYTYELVNPGIERKNKKLLVHLFIFFALYIFFAYNGIGDPYHFEKSENLFSLYFLITIVSIVTLRYSFLTLRLLQINQNKFKNEFSDSNPYVSLNWVKWLIWLILSMPFIGGISTIISLNFDKNPPELFTLLSQLFTCCSLIYFSLRQPVIYQSKKVVGKQDEIAKEESTSYSNITLSEEDKSIYMHQIMLYMEEFQPYLDPKLRMPELAEKLNIPRHVFSFLINEYIQINFFQFINQYRIDHAKTLLREGRYDNYTIEAISKLSGFNSKSTFNARFREITGITPKEYQQTKI